jgi:hypothetical protein
MRFKGEESVDTSLDQEVIDRMAKKENVEMPDSDLLNTDKQE